MISIGTRDTRSRTHFTIIERGFMQLQHAPLLNGAGNLNGVFRITHGVTKDKGVGPTHDRSSYKPLSRSRCAFEA